MDEAANTGAARLAAGLDAFYRFVEEHRVAWRMLFREANDPEMVAVLERIVAQVTSVVAALIAQDPGSRTSAGDDEVRGQAIEMLAQMLVGSVQSLSNWWADHQEVPRERMLEMTMDYAWLGLERLSQGNRWTSAGGQPPAP
jgi:hypothetical protein